MLTTDMVYQAQNRLRGYVHRTPLVSSRTLSEHLGVSVFLKLECLQKTGSFKSRGAFNKMLSLSAEDRARGVVAVSGGNHAQGVGYAARELGISATLVMPASTPRNYVEATRGYGTEVILVPDIRTAFAEAERLRVAGRVMIHPFDDPLIAAGQGTIGLEIFEDLPAVDRVYVSIGGGGLIAGIAQVMRTIRPDVRIIGVETNGADAMAKALAAGHSAELPAITSIARTLGAPKVSDFTFHSVKEFVEEVIVVDDSSTVTVFPSFAALRRTFCLAAPRLYALTHGSPLLESNQPPTAESLSRGAARPRRSPRSGKRWALALEKIGDSRNSETVKALFQILERCKYLVEPAAACCLVAAQRQKASFKHGEKIVILLCGGNVGTHDLVAFAQRFGIVEKSTQILGGQE